jgi:hypothetical protein
MTKAPAAHAMPSCPAQRPMLPMPAYWDTLSSGLVPIMITSARLAPGGLGMEFTYTVTATHGGYKRGTLIDNPSSFFIIPRSAARRGKYSTKILPHDWRKILNMEAQP